MNTPGQGQQEENETCTNLWNLLTINLKDKSFNNSKDWLEFIFKCVSHHGWGNFSDLHCSNYWKLYLWNFPPSLHHLIIRTHVKQSPNKFAQKSLFPHERLFKRKKSSHFFWGEKTLCCIFISFTISKSFIPNLCGTNYGLSK